MSHEVLITRTQSIFIFFANPGRCGPQHPNQPAPASTDLLRLASAWICKKNQKCFVFWLSGPQGTSNFDQHSLICSDLNYTILHSLNFHRKRWKYFIRFFAVHITEFRSGTRILLSCVNFWPEKLKSIRSIPSMPSISFSFGVLQFLWS